MESTLLFDIANEPASFADSFLITLVIISVSAVVLAYVFFLIVQFIRKRRSGE